MDLLDRLLEHDRWATTQLLDLSRGLTDAQLDQEFDIGHKSVRGTFEHMIVNIAFWTGLMTGQPVDEERGERSLAALIDRHERSYTTFATLGRRLRDEQRLDDTFIDHYDARKSFGGRSCTSSCTMRSTVPRPCTSSHASECTACPRSIMGYGTMRC